jgi:hypothetical protein
MVFLSGCDDYFEDVGLVFLNEIAMVYLLASFFLLKILFLIYLSQSIFKQIHLPMDIAIIISFHLAILYFKWKYYMIED